MNEHDWNQCGSRQLLIGGDAGDSGGIEWKTESASAHVGNYRLSIYAYGWSIYDTRRSGRLSEVMRGTVDSEDMDRCKREAEEALRSLSPESLAASLTAKIEALQAEHAALVAKIGGGQ